MCEHVGAQTFKTWLRTSQPGQMIVYAQPRGSAGFEIFYREQHGLPTGELKALMATTQWAGEQGYVHFVQKRLAADSRYKSVYQYEYRALRSNKRYRDSVGEIAAPIPGAEGGAHR
jgi:hypothetical protein